MTASDFLFSIHTKLHRSKTSAVNKHIKFRFSIHTKLHRSKTRATDHSSLSSFSIHTKLHRSKTSNRGASVRLVIPGNSAWIVFKEFGPKNLCRQLSFSRHTASLVGVRSPP